MRINNVNTLCSQSIGRILGVAARQAMARRKNWGLVLLETRKVAHQSRWPDAPLRYAFSPNDGPKVGLQSRARLERRTKKATGIVPSIISMGCMLVEL